MDTPKDVWQTRIVELKTFVQQFLSIANCFETEILVLFWWDIKTCSWEQYMMDLYADKGGPPVNLPKIPGDGCCFKYLNGTNPKVSVAALIPMICVLDCCQWINRSMNDSGFRVPFELLKPSCRRLGKKMCTFFGVPHLFKSTVPNSQEKGKEVANPRDLVVPKRKVVCSVPDPSQIPTQKQQKQTPNGELMLGQKRKRSITTKLYHHGSKDSTFTRIKYDPGDENKDWFFRVLQVVCKLSKCIRMNIKVYVLVSGDCTEMAIVPAEFFDDFNWKGCDVVEVSTYGTLLDMCKHKEQELISKVYGRR